MHERHTNREKYFREQDYTTRKHVIPFISSILEIGKNTSVLEIGCGEGGNLLPFLDSGCRKITGVDLSEGKIENAKKFFAGVSGGERVEFVAADIYCSPDLGKYDIIIMRDVLEHIHDQQRFLGYVKRFLNDQGALFIAFPPWHNPFGGHQQMCSSRVLSKMPWIHLMPSFMYRWLLKMSGESPAKIDAFMEIKETRINLGWFEKAIKKEGFFVRKKSLWFINPNFEIKFGLRPRHLPRFLSVIPVLRNFLTTTGYYIISMRRQER